MSTIRTFTLRSHEEVALTIEKIDKINARAAKQGLDNRYSYSVSSAENTVCRNGLRVTQVDFTLSVEGEAPVINGWRFVAAIDFEGVNAEPVVHTVPGYDGPMVDRSAIVRGGCAHCNTDRMRRLCYIVEDESHNRVQVGSSCVKDFIGHNFYPSWISDSDLGGLVEDYGSLAAYETFATASVVALSIAAQRTYGWVSRAAAGENMATADVVTTCLRPALNDMDREMQVAVASNVHEDDGDKAAEMLAWVLTQTSNSEYIANLQVAARSPFVSARMVGLLASLPSAYDRVMGYELERKAKAASNAASEYVGTVKERLVLENLTVESIRFIDGYYGTTVLYIFRSPEGNVIKWFSSREQDFGQGDVVSLKATIKGHEEYRGTKQTNITRATVVGVAEKVDA